ncbi:MAG: hypothetical protein JWL88_654 [Parcubacteria group bacterium]|nr:hypothetical protein [Parcubacteria group bacterium]
MSLNQEEIRAMSDPELVHEFEKTLRYRRISSSNEAWELEIATLRAELNVRLRIVERSE